MSGRANGVPEVAALRQYLPAIRAGAEALRQREAALAASFEPVGRSLVEAERRELEALHRILDRLGADGE